MVLWYVLDGDRNPIPASMEQAEAFLASRDLPRMRTSVGLVEVSTVFLCLNHSFSEEGPPVLFETMAFTIGLRTSLYQNRCCTWAEAEEMHRTTVEMARRAYLWQLAGARAVGRLLWAEQVARWRLWRVVVARRLLALADRLERIQQTIDRLLLVVPRRVARWWRGLR